MAQPQVLLLAVVLCCLVCASHAAGVVSNSICAPWAMYDASDLQSVDPAVGGVYKPIGAGPIAVAHALQLPCGNKFLMMEFGPTGKEGKLMLPHPDTNPSGHNVLQVWDRDDDSWTDVPTDTNSVCGGWARLSNGQVGLFAGHYATIGVKQADGMLRIRLFDPTSLTVTKRANLTAKRWYPTSLTLPNGDVWVPGGTWEQKPSGIWPKAKGADIYSHAEDRVMQVPMNPAMQDAGLGNWYIGSMVLPSGHVTAMNKNMMQVMNPWTGEAVAQAPPLPKAVRDLVWEFPRMGPQVHLRAPVMRPGEKVFLETMAFGGSLVEPALHDKLLTGSHIGPDRAKSEWKPCADVAVRIGLTIHPDGRHEFGQWQVEKMPGRRCIFDGLLLPNGHVLLIGGQKVGLGDLTDGGPTPTGRYNGGHEPYQEPWLYIPDAPPGKRFVVTGAKTRIARTYHATSIMTKDGDVFVGGSSNAGFWQSSHEADFSRTPLGVNEYRNEIYSPPYLFRPNRPRITQAPPTFVPYGSSFTVGFAFDSPAAITGIALVQPGGVTHNYAIGHRSQLLDFAVEQKLDARSGLLRVQAPANPNIAPPSHYLLFLLRDDTWSPGAWVQIRKHPRDEVPVDYPQGSRLVGELSASFEPGEPQPFQLSLAPGRKALTLLRTALAAGTGASGARISVAGGTSAPGSVVLRSTAVRLAAGSTCNVQLWARASADTPLVAQLVRLDAQSASQESSAAAQRAAAGPAPATPAGSQRFNLGPGAFCLQLLGPVRLAAGGSYELRLDLGLAAPGVAVDVDDVEVYCTT